MNDKVSFAAEIWQTLSKVDCSAHIEKKGNLSYLSWAWAWAELMNHYPESEYIIEGDQWLDNTTVEVRVTVTVREGENSFARQMWLPVMDHRNNAIMDPTSRMISDSRMRCLVKCLAMFGLGHYIYAGEDIPSAEKQEVQMATEQQMVLLQEYSDAGAIPDVTLEWLNKRKWNITADHAAKLLAKLKGQ